MLTIEEIIDEADIRVPNSFNATEKIDWINQINQEFFDVVKIPAIATFSADGNTSSVTLDSEVRAKNITKVRVNHSIYKSMLYENVNPGHNYFVFSDSTHALTLTPKPPEGTGLVVYNKIGTSNYTTGNYIQDSPDAPAEYHWIYILGLAERIAKAMNDVSLANNYAADFRNNLMLAQQNFAIEQ